MQSTEKDQVWVDGAQVPSERQDTGVERRVLAYCDAVMCVENRFLAGQTGPLHSHPHTQITYVAEGEFRFTIGTETRVVKKGDALLKQNGVEHGCVCLQDGVLLDIFAPMRRDFVEN